MEFNLSDDLCFDEGGDGKFYETLSKEKVKEFIRLLKDYLKSMARPKEDLRVIDKLAGEKLNGN
jgi:hypothetical protein